MKADIYKYRILISPHLEGWNSTADKLAGILPGKDKCLQNVTLLVSLHRLNVEGQRDWLFLPFVKLGVPLKIQIFLVFLSYLENFIFLYCSVKHYISNFSTFHISIRFTQICACIRSIKLYFHFQYTLMFCYFSILIKESLLGNKCNILQQDSSNLMIRWHSPSGTESMANSEM